MTSLLRRVARRARAVAAHPATAELALDDPVTIAARQGIIAEKRFLRRVYGEWYGWIERSLPRPPGAVLELGTGAGFLDERIPGLISSDVLPRPGLRALLDGCRLPFADGTLRAIVMINVLHHMTEVERFFADASRCLRPGGAVLLVEPWMTSWSRLVYALLQDEPCEPRRASWTFPAAGPLSGANLALAWIVFERDRDRFEATFPRLSVEEIAPLMPLSYLLSGGISSRVGLPGWSYRSWRCLERALPRDPLAMFAQIRLLARER